MRDGLFWLFHRAQVVPSRRYRPPCARKLALFGRSYDYGLTPLFCFNDPYRHSLAFCQISQLRSFDNRDVHEDVFAATVNLDEAHTLRYAELLDRPNHIYRGRQIRCASPRFSPRGGERQRFCSAALLDRKDLINLPAFLSLAHQDT